MAWRGQVLDVFPADAPDPLRVEIVDGKVASLRTFDPADQRTTGDCERRELGRVSEPSLGTRPRPCSTICPTRVWQSSLPLRSGGGDF
ncbi:hypothetical protein AB5I41_12475 [Sphingomonas sp. MMS24-JH45]